VTRHAVTRVLLLGYAGYAAVALPVLLTAGGAFGAVGAGVTAVAGVGHLAAAARYGSGHRGLRATLIATEAVLVPVQFGLSIPSDLPLAGLALSAIILGLLRPRFPRLAPAARKVVLTLHVGSSVGWLGASLCMVVLSATGLLARDATLRHNAYVFMHVFDLTVVIPLVVLALGSGRVVSLGTLWGLVQHWWVLAKFMLALAVPLVAGFSDFWIQDSIAGTAADPGADLAGIDHRLTALMVLFCVVLWTTTVLSVFKPWGRTPWNQRRPERRTRTNGPEKSRAPMVG
jgi:hypothetical protein